MCGRGSVAVRKPPRWFLQCSEDQVTGLSRTSLYSGARPGFQAIPPSCFLCSWLPHSPFHASTLQAPSRALLSPALTSTHGLNSPSSRPDTQSFSQMAGFSFFQNVPQLLWARALGWATPQVESMHPPADRRARAARLPSATYHGGQKGVRSSQLSRAFE